MRDQTFLVEKSCFVQSELKLVHRDVTARGRPITVKIVFKLVKKYTVAKS